MRKHMRCTTWLSRGCFTGADYGWYYLTKCGLGDIWMELGHTDVCHGSCKGNLGGKSENSFPSLLSGQVNQGAFWLSSALMRCRLDVMYSKDWFFFPSHDF